MTRKPAPAASLPTAVRPRQINRTIAAAVVLAVAVVGFMAPAGLLALVQDGPVALVIVAAGAGIGLSVLRLLGLGRRPAAFQLIAGTFVGMGLLGLLVLGAAALGLLNRPLWWAVLALVALVALVRGYHLTQAASPGPPGEQSPDYWRLLWLVVVPFGVLLGLTVSLPVGVLWKGEAHGYDAMSYHLQVPREWYDAGRLTYLPHNAYSNMPFLMEMLYLLSMVLTGGPLKAIYVAQMLHAAMAVLTVGGVWLACRPFSSRGAIVGGVAAATCPWLVYLGCLPYNEWGLGAGLAVGLAALCHAIAKPQDRSWGLAALSGLALGLAAGCKYTGVVMAAIPVGLGWAYVSWLRPGRRVDPLIVAATGLLAFAPWMIKNIVYTGNPLFPLAYRVFGGRDWTPELADRWRRGHRPLPRHASPTARMIELKNQVLVSPFFGALAIGGPLLGLYRLLRKRSAADVVVWVVLLMQLTIWLTATHLLGRFAVPIVVPLAVMVGLAAAAVGDYERLGLGGLLACVALLNLVWFAHLYQQHVRSQPEVHGALGSDMAAAWPMHKDTTPQDKILYVGWAAPFYIQRNFTYNVVFSRNPLAEQIARSHSPRDVIKWLQQQGYTYVLVQWTEVDRLAATYGYEKQINRRYFKRLERAGLRVVHQKGPSAGSQDERTLYKVPSPGR